MLFVSNLTFFLFFYISCLYFNKNLMSRHGPLRVRSSGHRAVAAAAAAKAFPSYDSIDSGRLFLTILTCR